MKASWCRVDRIALRGVTEPVEVFAVEGFGEG